MNKLTLAVVALVSGLAGGVVSRCISPAPVLAQQRPVTDPVELRAQRFVLVNQAGDVVATFAGAVTTLPQGMAVPRPGFAGPRPLIQLLDPSGQEIWRAGGNPVRGLALK